MLALNEKMGWSIQRVRMSIELTVLFAGWLLGEYGLWVTTTPCDGQWWFVYPFRYGLWRRDPAGRGTRCSGR